MSVISKSEAKYLRKSLGREPSSFELDVLSAEWSEHCSYKSSRKFIRMLPNRSRYVIPGQASDAAMLDIGQGYVLVVHIESHNHPSAVEPYGGAATGVGGVIRDILSLGARPIAILNALRFGPVDVDAEKQTQKSRWLMRNVVRGIADYGNCIGVPTVGGEVEFDSGFNNYCLVDVAAVGIVKRNKVIPNRADRGDIVLLVGGATGRDGIHGSSFASRQLNVEDRSAVQIPDPFAEKLLIEGVLEAVDKGCIKAMKDLGGGGLSCCLSEISVTIAKGLDVDISKVHLKERGMLPSEIMISESQERMLVITDQVKLASLTAVLDKYGTRYSIIGTVKGNRNLIIRVKGKIIMNMTSSFICHAPQINRKSLKPKIQRDVTIHDSHKSPIDLAKSILHLLSNPSIASKEWIYQQYDHEVGIRTVLKPGKADSSVLSLENGKFLAINLDGNSKQCNLDSYQGTLNVLSEACRNVVCTGGYPIAIFDHLQFGSPEKPDIFWTFKQTIQAIIDFCDFMALPVIGGKVSFYNETPEGPIKPSPVIGAIGLIDQAELITQPGLQSNNSLFIIGNTKDELGGSEYFQTIRNMTGGRVPKVDFEVDKRNTRAVSKLIRRNVVTSLHDCSKGGLAIALCEMAIAGETGFDVSLDKIPNSCSSIENLLFSESASRYILGTDNPDKVQKLLSAIDGIEYSEIGSSTGKGADAILYSRKMTVPVTLSYENLVRRYGILEAIMEQNFKD